MALFDDLRKRIMETVVSGPSPNAPPGVSVGVARAVR
jgi:hypothetical protein